MTDEAEPVWSQFAPASLSVDGETITFPVRRRISRRAGLRVVRRAVPFVDGEQLDETGLTAGSWTVEALFCNDLMDEDGIGTTPQLYPDRLEKLEQMLEKRKTMTFNGLIKRNVRVKAIEWTRSATEDEREAETLELSLEEDNESKLDAPRAAGVSAHVNLNQQVQEATFEADRAGMAGDGWAELTTLSSQLQAIINTPSEIRENVAQKADRIVAICDSLLGTIETNEQAVGFSDPATDAAYRALWALRNLADNAEDQARDGRPEVIVQIVRNPTNLYEIAVAAGKDIGAVFDLNPQIEDPNDIDPGTPVNLPK